MQRFAGISEIIEMADNEYKKKKKPRQMIENGIRFVKKKIAFHLNQKWDSNVVEGIAVSVVIMTYIDSKVMIETSWCYTEN